MFKKIYAEYVFEALYRNERFLVVHFLSIWQVT